MSTVCDVCVLSKMNSQTYQTVVGEAQKVCSNADQYVVYSKMNDAATTSVMCNGALAASITLPCKSALTWDVKGDMACVRVDGIISSPACRPQRIGLVKYLIVAALVPAVFGITI
jgi:hypothetical protein